jgi:hypothetical protein
MRTKKSIFIALAAAAFLRPMDAFAADAGANFEQLQEIVFTAQKRVEDVQRVPISVSVFDAASFDRLSIQNLAVVAAAASLQDASYVAGVTRQVAQEREKWFHLLRDLKLNFTPSSGNFVYFETGVPHADFAAALLKDGVEIGRAFPPYDLWARVSIGLPEENAIAHAAVRKTLLKS